MYFHPTVEMKHLRQFVDACFNGEVHPNSLEFKSAVMLCASTVIGLDHNRLAEFTGYSLKRNIIQNFVKRVQDQFMHRSYVHLVWLDKGEEMPDNLEKTVMIICDFMVAAGQFTRQPDGDDYTYSLTEKERKKVERMAKRAR